MLANVGHLTISQQIRRASGSGRVEGYKSLPGLPTGGEPRSPRIPLDPGQRLLLVSLGPTQVTLEPPKCL